MALHQQEKKQNKLLNVNLNEQSTFKTARARVWIRLIHLSTWIEPQGKQDARSLCSVPA